MTNISNRRSLPPLECGELSSDGQIIRSLNCFYDLVGHRPQEPDTIAKMAMYLGQQATPQQVDAALDRCVRECRYPVRLPDITQRIIGMEVPVVEAQMRAAWDVVIQFVDKYIGSDPEGNFGPEFGRYSRRRAGWDEHGNPKYQAATYPKLPQRLLDCVRRTGGWEQYKLMTIDDQPFLQKRFFEEYQAWVAVENVKHDDKEFAELAAHMPALRLIADRMGASKAIDAKPADRPLTDDEIRAEWRALDEKLGFRAKPAPSEPHSAAGMRERRAQAKQQVKEWVARADAGQVTGDGVRVDF